MKNRIHGVYAIAAALLAPLILPIPGIIFVYIAYPSEKAAEATKAAFSMSIGLGAIAWCGFAGWLFTYLIGKNKITKIITYPTLLCAIFLCMASVVSLIGRDKGKSFENDISGYWIPFSIGCIIGVTALDSDKKKSALEKRMDWMK